VNKAKEPGSRVALLPPRSDILAILEVTEAFEIDPEREARALVGAFDEAHSGLHGKNGDRTGRRLV
jgi:ATP sulfurylase